MREVTFTLTQPQMAAVMSTARRTVFLAGIGSGKTTALAVTLLQKLMLPGVVAGVFAPTRKMMHKAVLKSIKSTWQGFGIHENLDYVVNKTPPVSWGVRKLTLGNTSGVITMRWGSCIIFDGLENFDSQRGQEYDVLFIDEFRDVKEGALEVVEGRLRGETYKQAKLNHQSFIFTTPPPDPTELQRIVDLPDTYTVHATTYSNAHNLPPRYIDALKDSMSDVDFRREVLAELVPAVETPFAYAFNRDRHVYIGDPSEHTDKLVSFDFNVSPAVATLWEYDYGTARCFDEIKLENASIYDVCSVITGKYNYDWVVTGDASGWNRSGATRGLATYYKIIQEELQLRSRDIVVPRSNPQHKDSYAFVNAAFERKDVKIHSRCKSTIQDLTLVAYSPAKGIDKSNPKLGHLLDSVRYALHYIFRKDIYKKDVLPT